MRLMLGFIMFSCLWISQGRADYEKMTVVAFGDSIISGYGLPTADVFSAQLEHKLNGDGHPAQVFNAGDSGDTTTDGLARINLVLMKHPKWVVIEYGANDLAKGVPPEEIKKNLASMIGQFKYSNIKMVLTGVAAPVSVDAKYAEAFNAIYPDLAKEYDIILCPNFMDKVQGIAGFMQQDNIHPTREGVAVLVDKIAFLLEEAEVKAAN